MSIPAGVGAIRFARGTANLAQCVAFYRDLVGLPLLLTFDRDLHGGPAGAVFALPQADVTFELVEAGGAVVVDRHDQLVLYFAGTDARDHAVGRLTGAGLRPVEQYRYWTDNQAVTFRDPDGREVVLAPWVFGQDPPPSRGVAALQL